jgi:hypothetical protein
MLNQELSFNTYKALCVHLGEPAGQELAAFLQQLAARLNQVEKNKVDVIPIVPLRMGDTTKLGRRAA